MHRIVRSAVTVAVCAAAVTTSAAASTPARPSAPGSARPATHHPLGWQRYHSEDVSYPAGDVCAFAVRSKVVFDQEYVRTTSSYADGSPRVQDYSGPLVVRVTNLDTGRSVTKDLSAYGVFRFAPSGAISFDAYGPVGVGFHPGDGLPAGYYVLDGYHRVAISPAGVKTVTIDQGTEENVCPEIA